MSYTITKLRADIKSKNYNQAYNHSIYFFREQGRNGYQAIDIYKVLNDGSLSCVDMLVGGTSRECYQELRSVKYYSKPAKKMTRKQAKVILSKYADINFNDSVYKVSNSDLCLLAEYAKLTGYRKPNKANASTGNYFFRHLQNKVI